MASNQLSTSGTWRDNMRPQDNPNIQPLLGEYLVKEEYDVYDLPFESKRNKLSWAEKIVCASLAWRFKVGEKRMKSELDVKIGMDYELFYVCHYQNIQYTNNQECRNKYLSISFGVSHDHFRIVSKKKDDYIQTIIVKFNLMRSFRRRGKNVFIRMKSDIQPNENKKYGNKRTHELQFRCKLEAKFFIKSLMDIEFLIYDEDDPRPKNRRRIIPNHVMLKLGQRQYELLRKEVHRYYEEKKRKNEERHKVFHALTLNIFKNKKTKAENQNQNC